ncbi:hypothetical protein AB9R04_07525, partial [Neisseria gonorrhoeae]
RAEMKMPYPMGRLRTLKGSGGIFIGRLFFCNRLTQSGFLCKNCHNSRLSSSGAANAFKIPTKGTFSYHVRLSRL